MGFIPLAVLASGSKYIRGEQVFTSSGTFTVPDGVDQISVVCVGGGAGGDNITTNGYIRGPGGGGLGYKTLSVTPGQNLSVVVGAGGPFTTEISTGGRGFSGGDSYVINSSTVLGGGGKATSGSNLGGAFVGDGGGNGGNGGVDFNEDGKGGGGGAGGYSGSGGDGGKDLENGENGSGGGGGGGGATSQNTPARSSGEGGGVGLNGQGSSGAGGLFGSDGQNGEPGSGGSGKLYGGGGSSIGPGNSNAGGGNGAVRIIWGKGEVYPTPRNRML